MNTSILGADLPPRTRQLLPEQLLLRAALWRGDEAIQAWHQWKEHVDFNLLDPVSFPLIPLLYRNLQNQGVCDPILAKYKGIYRQIWSKNQILLRVLASLLSDLQHAGIKPLVFKDAALSLLHYKDYGLRPVSKLDLLVPAEQALAALSLIQRSGWTLASKRSNTLDAIIRFSHSIGLSNGNDQYLELRWHMLRESCKPGADADFWNNAVPLKIHDVSTLSLDATDQLLQVCVHGARWSPTLPFHWVADAVTIINSSARELDWERLVEHAQKRRLASPLRDTLTYLNSEMRAPIPSATLAALATLAATENDHVEDAAKIGRGKLLGFPPAVWCSYTRLAQRSGVGADLMGFGHYLQFNWDVKHLWQVPLVGFTKGVRRFTGRARIHQGERR